MTARRRRLVRGCLCGGGLIRGRIDGGGQTGAVGCVARRGAADPTLRYANAENLIEGSIAVEERRGGR